MNTIYDISKIENVEIAGVDGFDYPKFCDAYIDYAEYNGVEMTSEEIEALEKQHPDFVQELALEEYTNREPNSD